MAPSAPASRGARSGGPTLAERKSSFEAAAVRNIPEWYEWTIYRTLSVYLAAHFFSKSDPNSAMLSNLAIFAGGFVAKPLEFTKPPAAIGSSWPTA